MYQEIRKASYIMTVLYSTGLPTVNDNPLEVLSGEHRELIEKLVTNQEKYELPSEEDIARLAVSTVLIVNSMSQNSWEIVNPVKQALLFKSSVRVFLLKVSKIEHFSMNH